MGWLVIVEWSARIILLLLILLSFYSIAIIFERRKFFAGFRPLPSDLQPIFAEQKWQVLDLYAQNLIEELKKNPDRQNEFFDYFCFVNRKKLEKGLPVLATLGSTTPFIGLLGTILGIIVSFGQLSKGAGDTNTVMFMLAEALILTAVGLLVAIPAVIAFNIYSRKTKNILAEWQGLKNFYSVAKR